MVGKDNEDGVVIPRLFPRLAEELSDAPVGILHDLRFRFLGTCLHPTGHNVWRVVADGEDCRHERFPVLGRLVDHRQRIVEEVFVGHAKTIGHLVGRVVLLRINLVVAIGAEEGIHVVVLRLMCHEEEVVVALLLEHGGQSAAPWRHRSLHQVAHHQCREGVERSGKSVVGVYASRIEMGEGKGVMVEAVEGRGERLLLSEGLHETCRHRLHENDHHVGCRRHAVGDNPPVEHRRAVDHPCDAQRLPGMGHGLAIGHEVQFGVLFPQVVERTGEQVEGGRDAQLIEERVLAIVCLTDFDGVVAYPSPYAEDAKANESSREHQLCHDISPSLRGWSLTDKPVGSPAPPPDSKGEEQHRDKEQEDIGPIGCLAHQHACGGTHIAEPSEDGRVEVLEEISEIGDIGGRDTHEYGEKHHYPHGSRPPQHLGIAAEDSRQQEHGKRQNHHIACHDIVEPQSLDESRGHRCTTVFRHHGVESGKLHQTIDREHEEACHMQAYQKGYQSEESFHCRPVIRPQEPLV